MRGFVTAAIMVLAVTGLSACNRNKAANNMTAKNAVAPAAAPAAPAAAAAMDPAAFRAELANQCAQAVRANPNAPVGADLDGLCGCAVEATLAGQADPFAFTQTPQGQQAFTQAMAQCAANAGVTAGGAPAEEADGAEGGEEATE
jgi:hypothetical protein